MKILIVDDEPAITETLGAKFQREGYTVFTGETAEEGLAKFKKVRPDLVILDIMLPNRSGYELCRAIRKSNSTPIIFVSARASEEDRVMGLELGADDYVTKPYNMAEVAARVKAILRRSSGDSGDLGVETDGLRIDPRTHEAHLHDKRLELSPKEFALLLFLAKNSGQVFTREQLLDRVWGQDAYVSARTVDVHIRWLRTRIEVDPASPTKILTVRGIGYKFVG